MAIMDAVMGYTDVSTDEPAGFSSAFVEDKVRGGSMPRCQVSDCQAGLNSLSNWLKAGGQHPALRLATCPQDCCFDPAFMRGIQDLITSLVETVLALAKGFNKVCWVAPCRLAFLLLLAVAGAAQFTAHAGRNMLITHGCLKAPYTSVLVAPRSPRSCFSRLAAHQRKPGQQGLPLRTAC